MYNFFDVQKRRSFIRRWYSDDLKIVYDQIEDHIEEIYTKNSFWTMIPDFYDDLEEKQAKTLIKSIGSALSLMGAIVESGIS